MKIRFKVLIYLAVLFLAYDSLNLPNISILDRKPISLFFCAIFLIINIDKLLKVKFNITEIIFLTTIIISFIIGIMKTKIYYNNDMIGIRTALNSIIGSMIVYLAFKIYFYRCNKERIDKTVIFSFKGYIIITLVSGFLQLFYINIIKLPFLENLFEVFLFNKLNYISYGRIHFMVSEPSFVGGFFYLIFVPCALYLYKNGKMKKNSFICIVVLMIVLNTMSFSNRFIIDSMAFALIFTIIISKKKSIIIKYFTMIVFVIVLFLFNVVFINNSFNIKNDNLYRIEKIFSQNSFSEDQSFMVRKSLISTAIEGFIDKPITGYGTGNYKYVLMNNFIPTSNIKANNELMEYMNSGNAVVTYSFYTTTLVENGVLGLIIILCVINTCLRNKYKKNELVLIIGIFILYIFIQNEFNSYLPIMIYLSMFNSNINFKKVEYKNENINNYSML